MNIPVKREQSEESIRHIKNGVEKEYESVVSTPDIHNPPQCPTCGQNWPSAQEWPVKEELPSDNEDETDVGLDTDGEKEVVFLNNVVAPNSKEGGKDGVKIVETDVSLVDSRGLNVSIERAPLHLDNSKIGAKIEDVRIAGLVECSEQTLVLVDGVPPASGKIVLIWSGLTAGGSKAKATPIIVEENLPMCIKIGERNGSDDNPHSKNENLKRARTQINSKDEESLPLSKLFGNNKSKHEKDPLSVSNRKRRTQVKKLENVPAIKLKIDGKGGSDHISPGTEKYVCSSCEKSYATKRFLRRHVILVHGSDEHRYTCNFCSKGFVRQGAFEKHVGKHTGVKPFVCPACGQGFGIKKVFEAHMSAHPGVKPYPCHICKKGFLKFSNRKRHIAWHSDKKPYLCEICSKRFSNKNHLLDHMANHTGRKPFTCDLCGKGFRQKYLLKNHMDVHTKPSLCELCGKRFTNKWLLQIHMNQRHREIVETIGNEADTQGKHRKSEKHFTCTICNKGFASKLTLKNHGSVHATEKLFVCSMCNKAFASKMSLKIHGYAHTESRPFACMTCGRTFKQKIVLKKHMTKHTGIKPHHCTECNASFTSTSNLKRHYLVHTGDKPFVCQICNKGFSQKQALQGHIYTHTGEKPFVCVVCDRKFSDRGTLNKHLKIHGGAGMDFNCNYCSSKFASRNLLEKHLETTFRCREINCEKCGTEFLFCKSFNDHCVQYHREIV